jgi:Arc/MetJ-type ribon-helix-helix transcriptional regulator
MWRIGTQEIATMAGRGVMTITLRPEHEKAIAQAIQSGAYQNPDEVIERALAVLRLEDEWLSGHKDEIGEKIDRAFAQFQRGEFLSSSESKADMAKRKTEWLSEQKG